MKYLFNWNAPIIKSQHEPNTYFHGAQYVLKTTDEGHSWQEISPDLTRNQDEKQGNGGVPYTNEAVGAENYGTLSYIIESPHEAGTMITGSDDGFVHITRDGGNSWQNITPKKLPETLINAIDISPHDKGTIYIATTRYKFNDFTPALYKSTDYGKSWKAISNGIPYGAYTRVVREDPVRKDLLFAGTELGLYVSLDGGSNWQPYQRNLPVTPITDLLIKHDDLIIATQGRSFWILDDMNLFRQYDGSSTPKLYAPEPAVMANWYSAMNAKNPSGTSDFVGVNPASGVVLYYSLPELGKDQEARLEIKDQAGNTVRTFTSKEDSSFVAYEGYPSRPATLDKKLGLNRFVWDMRHETLEGIPGVYIEASFRGHKAIPGTYTATLSYGDYSTSVPVEIRKNPLLETTDAQYQDYHEFMSGAEATYNEMTQQVNRIYEKSKKLEKIAAEKELNAEVSATVEQLIKDLKTYDAIMAQRLSKAYDDVENYVNGFTANYIRAFNEADSDQPRVTAGTKKRIGELNTEWQKHKSVADPLEQRLKELEQRLFEAGIGSLSL